LKGSFEAKNLDMEELEMKDFFCRNPNLGLATKARAYKVAGQKGSLGVMLHAPRSARGCEGIDLHTPKGTPTFGVGVPVDFQMFRE